MLITSVQFALQHLLARLAIATPWVAAPEEALSWEDWWKKGAPAPGQPCWRASSSVTERTTPGAPGHMATGVPCS